VSARVYEARRRAKAIIILPHWNSSLWSYRTIAGYLSRLGASAIELTLPYHGLRNRDGAAFSDYFLSANLGRTILSVRQAVLDTRAVIDWLYGRGYTDVGLIGISLGSCIAGLVAAHDRRVRCSALLLTAGDFGEVVWTGRATRHIRQGLEPAISLQELAKVWSIISTGTFAKEISRREHSTLIVSGVRDNVVKPYLTQRVVDQLRGFNARLEWKILGCGHYSLALFPFNVRAFVILVRFLYKNGLVWS
jgi:pimeloyl-ACP methyl ester carboxylesterase